MFVYKIIFLGGSSIQIRANSPKEAWESASKAYKMEVIHVKFLRGGN